MKRAAVIAAGLALTGSVVVATPSFGTTSACDQLQRQLDQAELRLARRGLDTKAGARALGDIFTIKQTARILHCNLH